MKIGIISDSHGKRTSLAKAVNKLGKVDQIFHLGDLYSDAIYIENTFNIKTNYVKGNCDFSHDVDTSLEVELEGKRFFLTHGHMYRVKWGIQYLQQVMANKNFDVVLFGHTHVPEVFFDGKMLFMNPGSTADPRLGKKPSVGIIELTPTRLIPYILNLED